MIGYRISSYDTPCPPSPSRRDGRWARAGDEVVNYWSEHPYTCWAELYRFQGVDADGVGEVRQRLWVARLDHLDVLDLTGPAAAGYGLSEDDLVDDDWRACQDAARRLVADGQLAVRVPSAALVGTTNLLLFGQRLAIPLDDEVLDPDVDIPCAVAADRSIGVPAVVPAVRYRDEADPAPFVQELPTPVP